MTPPSASPAAEARRARAPSQTVTVNISESNQDNPHYLEVSECVETRTVTTTTRLTRKFPHIFENTPMPLECLDAKEFPLAQKPTPPELLAFTYNLPAPEEEEEEGDEGSKFELTKNHQADCVSAGYELNNKHNRVTRRTSTSPSEAYSRRSRQNRPKSGSLRDSISQCHNGKAHATLVSDKLRKSLGYDTAEASGSGSSSSSSSGRRDHRGRRAMVGCLATPDASETVDQSLDHQLTSRPRIALERTPNIQDPTLGSATQNRASSPAGSDSHTAFGSNVATPPITDADAQPFGDVHDAPVYPSRPALHHPRPSIDVVAAQDASLPSPRLSPTLAAAQEHTGDEDGDGQMGESSFQTTSSGAVGWVDESQSQENETNDTTMSLVTSESRALARRTRSDESESQSADPRSLLEAFDSLKPEMKTYMMYQLLRRCPRPTLRVVANAVNPALKCDFFAQLPLELSYHILSYLDCRDLCRAAQVSKHWRNIVDRNETGWKELFDRDGFELPAGEMSKAITQGWGWQDPLGAMGFERDLSMHSRLTTSEHELTRNLTAEPAPKTRNPKRKRGPNTYSTAERSKRRASAQEALVREERSQVEVRQHKSAGPLSAANSAVTAVPDPHLGLPSLRQLHLFKSLYRRHYMMRQSWTSGEVRPSHVAFAAHPRHVITCLQFDEDKIITGSDDTFIHVYDTKTGKLRKKLAGHEGGVWALQYQGNILVSGSTDRSVRVWDIEKGICQQVFYGHTSTVRCLQILTPTQTGTDANGRPIMQPEKPLIITGSRDSQLRVWRLPEVGSKRYIQTGPPAQEYECPYFIRALYGHASSVRAIAAHGDLLVSGSYDNTVRVWRISTGECLHVLHGHSQKVYSVVLDHERNRCISGSMDSLVKIWDLTTGACLYTLEGHSLLVGLLDLRDERLVSAAADSTLRIWDPETGRCKNTLMAHTGAITCFQHDRTKVISGSEKNVKMWDAQTGECIQDLLTDLSGVWQVKFDGRRCVAAVQRDSLTYVEVLDFGAVRDGRPPEELGRRSLINEDEVQAIMDDEP